MHALLDTLHAMLLGIWKRRWIGIAVGWAVALIAAVVIPMIPERFEARARIYVDTQTVLKPLMQGLAYQPDIDQQVRMLAQTVISRPNIEALLKRPELGMASASSDDREAMISRLMRQIQLTPGTSGLYTISYRDLDPQRAQQTVEAVLALFVNLNAQVNKRDSEDASRFIAEQIGVYEAKLADAEGRLKEFRIRNMGVMGITNQDFFSRITAMSEELEKLQRDLAAAERARDTYRETLTVSVENPQLAEIEAAQSAARKQLDELLRRFTDEHPDVVSTRDLIARLEARKQRSAAAEAPSRQAPSTSPVTQRLQGSLADAEAQVASLRSRVAAEQQRLDQLRSLAGRVPQVDAELAQLNRDYEVIRKNYEQLVSRRESAALGEKLDESSQLAIYRVVEPPRVADQPVFPGRTAMALIAVVASFVAGLLVPIMLHLAHPTFTDARSLQELTGRPVMGTVSMAFGLQAARARRSAPIGFAVALAALLLVQGTWLAWIAQIHLAG